VGVCNQITFLILHYISSRLVTLLKVIDAPIQVPDIFELTVSFKFLNFCFQICLLLFLKCLLASRLNIVQIIYIALAWIMYPLLFSLLHCSKKPKHSSSNHSLCCFNSCRPRLSVAEVLMFSLMFFKALFMSSSSLKFSKSANLFVNSI